MIPEPYESYVERLQLALTPEFDTEQLTALALWADGSSRATLQGGELTNQLTVRLEATNYPGQLSSLAADPTGQNSNVNLFNIGDDYKIDMRVHGRFMNFRVTDGPDVVAGTDGTVYNHETEWRLSGMQADVMKGGTR